MTLTAHQKTKMIYQPDLEVYTVGGVPIYGSLNEYEAARLKPGDVVTFIRDRPSLSGGSLTGRGTVRCVWLFDGLCVDIDTEYGTDHLRPECDVIEKETAG